MMHVSGKYSTKGEPQGGMLKGTRQTSLETPQSAVYLVCSYAMGTSALPDINA